MSDEAKNNEEEAPREPTGLSDDDAKLFIGGISADTTEESLKEYMTKNGGEVDKVELKYDRNTQRMRGFGFVTFKDQSSAEKILESGPHILDGKQIDPKRAEKQVKLEAIRTKKVFVGGLKPETTEEKLKEYFNEYGAIQQVEFIFEKGTERKKRGFCFIEFDSEDVVDQLVKKQYHTIAGRTVEVKHAYSKEQQAQMAAKGLWMPGGRGRGGREGYGGAGMAGFGYLDQSMAGQYGMDPYYGGYGSNMMGYGSSMPYGGMAYPTVDYSSWTSGRSSGGQWLEWQPQQRSIHTPDNLQYATKLTFPGLQL
eukprot:gene11979-13217_t